MIKTYPHYKIDSFKFNSGEVNIALKNELYSSFPCICSIYARIDSSDELMKLCLIADANKRITKSIA